MWNTIVNHKKDFARSTVDFSMIRHGKVLSVLLLSEDAGDLCGAHMIRPGLSGSVVCCSSARSIYGSSTATGAGILWGTGLPREKESSASSSPRRKMWNARNASVQNKTKEISARILLVVTGSIQHS